MSDRGRNIAISVISLLMGGLCYLIFRENTYVAEFFSEFSLISYLRISLEWMSCDFIKYYLQDFLWGLSFSCGIIAIYNPKTKGILLSSASVFGFGCVWELLQYFGIVGGTGDWLDVMMYLSASLTSVLVNLKKRRD